VTLTDGTDETDEGHETQPWGERLRAWREDTKHWSRAEFREEVEAASHKTRERRGRKLDERLIGRWENGDILRPQGFYRRILVHMGAPLPLAAGPTVLRKNVDFLAGVEMWGSRTTLQMLRTEMGDEVNRRFFIAQSGLSLAGLANPWLLDPVDRVVDSIDGRRIGHTTITDIESITATRRRMDDAFGGGSLLSAVREDLRVSITLLTRAAYSADVGRRLYAATAEQARLASWLCFDTGRYELAQHYTQMALRAAHAAEDRQIGANVLGFGAAQAGSRGDGVAAEAFSRIALAGGRGTLTPAVEGSIHARLGRGLTLLGDLSGAAASFDTAEGLLLSSDSAEEPDWIYWFTLGDLHGIEGKSYLLANKPGVAVEHLQQAVAGTDAAFTRDRALWLSTTATAQVLNGDLEEGRHTAEDALVILGEGLESGHVVKRFTEFCGALRTHNTRDAEDFEERLAAYTHSSL
jgi:hypothetical protein